jgi:purine-binding chemotaxis protein CheW
MKASTSAQARVARSRSAANKYLTFVLGSEHYGLPILKVQEIIGILDITPVPRMPAHVRGVVNLRGKVIPVIDLRLRFGIDAQADTKRTCIVVVQIRPAAGADPVTLGMVVDVVSEVQDIPADQIEPAPAFGTTVDTAYILGVGKIAKRVVILLDIDRVLTSSEVATAAETAPAATKP